MAATVSAKAKPPIKAAKALPVGLVEKPQGRLVAQSALTNSPIKALPGSSVRRPVVKKAAVAVTARCKSRIPKRPPFRQVLASTMQQPKAALASRNKPVSDRTRRITTRFSPTEERRIEKCAAELGITVSSYLRQCALASVAPKPLPEAPAVPTAAKNRKPTARSGETPMQHAAPAPSLLGGWISLLRNRFLGPPVRFSDEA
jgi:hypothetical protein